MKKDYKAANNYPRMRDLEEPLRTEFHNWLADKVESFPLPYKWENYKSEDLDWYYPWTLHKFLAYREHQIALKKKLIRDRERNGISHNR